jgi:hypothetical protein
VGLFIRGNDVARELRTSIVVDYQNLHLTGHGLFESSKHLPRHKTLLDPLLFARQLLIARNRAQHEGYPAAVLQRVLVFRGQPSPEHDAQGYARSLAQKSHWERDRRVAVTLRPLKYEYQRDATGRLATDHLGRKIVLSGPREKGVDVLCALSVMRLVREGATDLVILASSDSDLSPVLDEARDLGLAKLETCCWWDAKQSRGYQLHPVDRTRPLWNTRLDEAAFAASRDPADYR